MCVSPRFYCTVDLLRELCSRKARAKRQESYHVECKKWLKTMVENSNNLHENEIHRVDNPSNEGSKNTLFYQTGPKVS